MPSIGEVNSAFIKDKIASIVGKFYDNIIESKKLSTPNHFGTASFCQFAKYAIVNSKIIKRGYDETDLKETTIYGIFDEYKIELTEIKELPGWILGTSGGYSMILMIDGTTVIDYKVDQYDFLVTINAYIKSFWIDMLQNENKVYLKDIQDIWIKNSRVDNPVDPDKFKL